jgi:hypothetical protein
LEKHHEVLRITLAELEAARKAKMKATTEASKKEDKIEVQRHASYRRVQVVAAATADGRDREALRRSSWPVTE